MLACNVSRAHISNKVQIHKNPSPEPEHRKFITYRLLGSNLTLRANCILYIFNNSSHNKSLCLAACLHTLSTFSFDAHLNMGQRLLQSIRDIASIGSSTKILHICSRKRKPIPGTYISLGANPKSCTAHFQSLKPNSRSILTFSIIPISTNLPIHVEVQLCQ